MAKKHKKKVYNTPKKSKHVHEKVNVSNFLASFNNSRCCVCQSILAIHFDRTYCGKCCISKTN